MGKQRQTATTKADKVDLVARCLFFSPKHKDRLPSASVHFWTPRLCFAVEVFTLGFTQGCHDTHTDSLLLSSQLLHESQNRGCCLLRWAAVHTMTTTFDLRHSLSGQTCRHHTERRVNRGQRNHERESAHVQRYDKIKFKRIPHKLNSCILSLY